MKTLVTALCFLAVIQANAGILTKILCVWCNQFSYCFA